jgi:hypothetical protein
MNITFAMLKEDLVETLGFIDAQALRGRQASPAALFGERLKNAITADPRLIENTVNDFISRGYIRAEESAKGLTWRWA